MSTIPVNNFVMIKDIRQKGIVLRHTGAGRQHTIVRHYMARGGSLVESTYMPDELIDLGPETSYTVHINEAQRAALQALLRENPALIAPDQPLAYWHGMMEVMRANEQASPGVLHGLCP